MIGRIFRLGLLAAAATVAAYQVPRTLCVPAGASWTSDFVFENFYPAEGDRRWSPDRASLHFPDPAAGPWRVEVDLAGFRPRGVETPLVRLVGGSAETAVQVDRKGATAALITLASGLWTSDLVVSLETPTFSPSRQDPRRLGVQVLQARLVPTGGAIKRPPLRPIAFAVLATLLVFGLCLTAPRLARHATRSALLAAILLAMARRWAPLETSLLLPDALVVLSAALIGTLLRPRWARASRDTAGTAVRFIIEATSALVGPQAAALAIVALLGLVLAHRAHPSVTFDIGSDRPNWLAGGFGPFDSTEGRRFRTAHGAWLDLRDFASGGSLRVAVTAAALGSGEPVTVGRSDASGAGTLLSDGRWQTASWVVAPGAGWRPGPLVRLGDDSTAPVRVERITIEGRGTFPTGRTAVLLLTCSLLVAVACGVAGLAPGICAIGGSLLAAGLCAGLALDPGVVIPFLPALAVILALATTLSALVAASGHVRGRRVDAVVLASATIGFATWFAATAFPLYRGGHFLFHSAIAEEIWKGRFLIYYLPYPGSMLSQQAQWGNVIVPHPCLYQLLVSPLAALPHSAFLLAEKGLLAAFFASLVFVTAAIAARLSGMGAARWSAATFVTLVPTYQLLGLGHLMTILGVWASSLAFAYLFSHLPRLREPWVWRAAVALLVLCFLSYFAALLFTGLVLVLYLAWLSRRERDRAWPLFTALVAATAVAFGLYYAYWFWPFLSESLPALASGKADAAQEHHRYLLGRILSQPGKLDYSYGSWTIPVLAGLGLVSRRAAAPRERWLALLWLSILPLVMGMDLFFNFLLKHHYYVMVPVAVGFGAVLASLDRLGRSGRAAAFAVFAVALWLGADTALQVAVGLIP